MHFRVGHEGAVTAGRHGGARRQVQHVAVAEQRLRAHLIENGARIHLGRHLEGDAAGNVGLDEAGDDIHRRPLRRQDQVDAGGARLLRQARDQLLDLLADDHHEVGELVDDDDDVRQRLEVRDLRLIDRGIVGGALDASPDRGWACPRRWRRCTGLLKPAMLRTPSADMSW